MTIEGFMKEITPFLLMPVTIAMIRGLLYMILNIMRGDRFIEVKSTNINITEEEPELNIDKDLMKYFNYKEQKNV